MLYKTFTWNVTQCIWEWSVWSIQLSFSKKRETGLGFVPVIQRDEIRTWGQEQWHTVQFMWSTVTELIMHTQYNFIGSTMSFGLDEALNRNSFLSVSCWEQGHILALPLHSCYFYSCGISLLLFYMIYDMKHRKKSNSPLKDVTTSWFTLGSWGSILNHRGNHTSSLHDVAWQPAVKKREWEGNEESEGGRVEEKRMGGTVPCNEAARRQPTWGCGARDSQGYNPQSPDCNLQWHHATVLWGCFSDNACLAANSWDGFHKNISIFFT